MDQNLEAGCDNAIVVRQSPRTPAPSAPRFPDTRCVIRIRYAYCTHTILGAPPMGRKVRKTLNIDAEKLKQAREYLKLDTETEVIDRLLDDLVWERRLLDVLRSAPKSFKTFRSPLTTHPPPHLSRRRRR